ncbi:MAG TPA: ATP-binding protein [Myxococcales bacterium]|nr:ATP-binding protein [Myxococcales bacterium]HIK84036.1 ATP-binding protein [Myxococcales bacterium]
MGLSVAHSVVTDHGGTLSIESKENDGTTITISIRLFESSDSKKSGPVHDTLSAAI